MGAPAFALLDSPSISGRQQARALPHDSAIRSWHSMHVGEAGQARRRLSAPARRSLILAAARTAILAKGLASVSVREIAREAGISSGTVTHHFPSIDELLTAVLRAESARFNETRAQILAGRRSALEGLFALGDRLFEERVECGSTGRCGSITGRVQLTTRTVPVGKRRTTEAGESSLLLGRRGRRTERIRMVDQDAMATEVVALIDGLALQTFAELDGNVHPHQQEGTERGHNPRVPGLRLGCWSCSRLRSNYRDTT